MDTARAARHRSSRVGRRAETRLNPRDASRKRRQKGDGGPFGPASPPIIGPTPSARDHGGEAEFAASDSYRGRHDNHAWCRKFESPVHPRLENLAPTRDFGPRDGVVPSRPPNSRALQAIPRNLAAEIDPGFPGFCVHSPHVAADERAHRPFRSGSVEACNWRVQGGLRTWPPPTHRAPVDDQRLPCRAAQAAAPSEGSGCQSALVLAEGVDAVDDVDAEGEDRERPPGVGAAD